MCVCVCLVVLIIEIYICQRIFASFWFSQVCQIEIGARCWCDIVITVPITVGAIGCCAHAHTCTSIYLYGSVLVCCNNNRNFTVCFSIFLLLLIYIHDIWYISTYAFGLNTKQVHTHTHIHTLTTVCRILHKYRKISGVTFAKILH